MDNQDLTSNDYRQCFSTDPGRRVLGHILIQAGYFDTELQTTEQLAVLNFAKGILKEINGVPPRQKDTVTPDRVAGYIESIIKLGTGK